VVTRPLSRRVTFWVAGSVVGGALVALPDSDERILSLSEDHGPALLDLLGTAVLVASWLPVAVVLPSLWRSVGGASYWVATLLVVAGAAGLVVAIGADLGWWWVLAVAALLAGQVVLLTAGRRLEVGSEP
jgi:hypothetical protein